MNKAPSWTNNVLTEAAAKHLADMVLPNCTNLEELDLSGMKGDRRPPGGCESTILWLSSVLFVCFLCSTTPRKEARCAFFYKRWKQIHAFSIGL
jgi:hypothetical protein